MESLIRALEAKEDVSAQYTGHWFRSLRTWNRYTMHCSLFEVRQSHRWRNTLILSFSRLDMQSCIADGRHVTCKAYPATRRIFVLYKVPAAVLLSAHRLESHSFSTFVGKRKLNCLLETQTFAILAAAKA